jgi:hypothetical protein
MTALVSDRQLSASRANAQRSTGPQTPAGKQRASANAVKHGFLARVLPDSDPEARREAVEGESRKNGFVSQKYTSDITRKCRSSGRTIGRRPTSEVNSIASLCRGQFIASLHRRSPDSHIRPSVTTCFCR